MSYSYYLERSSLFSETGMCENRSSFFSFFLFFFFRHNILHFMVAKFWNVFKLLRLFVRLLYEERNIVKDGGQDDCSGEPEKKKSRARKVDLKEKNTSFFQPIAHPVSENDWLAQIAEDGPPSPSPPPPSFCLSHLSPPSTYLCAFNLQLEYSWSLKTRNICQDSLSPPPSNLQSFWRSKFSAICGFRDNAIRTVQNESLRWNRSPKSPKPFT